MRKKRVEKAKKWGNKWKFEKEKCWEKKDNTEKCWRKKENTEKDGTTQEKEEKRNEQEATQN